MEPYESRNFSLPLWLQARLETVVGTPPVWAFPKISPCQDVTFSPLIFNNRDRVLAMFSNDVDPWVDERFKTPAALYEYVAYLRIYMAYSKTEGGMDWIISKAGVDIGLLHIFDCSKAAEGYSHRSCSIGYAFCEAARGQGLALDIVRHAMQYAFRQLNMLHLFAEVDAGNTRSLRFLEKLGFEDELDIWKEYQRYGPPKGFVLRSAYRSAQARAAIHRYWKQCLDED